MGVKKFADARLRLGEDLDFDHELSTVGLSNIASGCCGGFTGSYLFSHTILAMRNTRSRSLGVVVILIEGLVVMVPVAVTSYIPSFFFGAVLTLICLNLVEENLIECRNVLSRSEYILCWATFLLICAFGINQAPTRAVQPHQLI